MGEVTTALSPATVDRIETALDAFGTEEAPGFAALVIRDGEVVHRTCRGLANLEYGLPITTETTFHIASMSKQFAGFALAMVADKGLLDLDGDIREHLPYVPDFGTPITPRQLAHHTSGLRDQWGELVMSGWRIDDIISTDDVIGLVRRMQDLNFTPQHGFSYSNTGYTLMGELIRAVDGRSLRDFCAEEIFAPLGMTATHFHDEYDELVANRSYSYFPKPDGGFTHAVLSYAVVGATSLHTTVEDLARWDQNFYDRKVGSEKVFGLMREVGVLADGTSTGYAFGLMHDTYRGQRREHHSGGDAGFRSQGERYPELSLSVYVLCNHGGLDSSGVARTLTDAVMDELELPPNEAVGTPVQDGQRFTGDFIDTRTGYAITIGFDNDQPTFMGLPLTQVEPQVLKLMSAITLRFSEDADQVDVSMTAIQPFHLERYAPVRRTAQELEELVGTYWSEELETRYVVSLIDGAVELEQRKLGPMTLTPTTKDCFTAKPKGVLPLTFAVAFDRDSSGAIEGFRLSMPRIDNVRVLKQR